MSTATFDAITPAEANARLGNEPSTFLLDVRSPAEFESVHATPATNLPLDQLDAEGFVSSLDSTVQTVYVICKSGGRSSKACEQLIKYAPEGVRIVNVTGGTDAWDAAGLPVARGRQTMSIDRQVRIVAGSLVVLGAALSYFHPAFVGLSAFIGAGLVFAGVTDTCGMAEVLARMPWNQAPKQTPQQAANAAAASCNTGG